jgi:hypothetical protein
VAVGNETYKVNFKELPTVRIKYLTVIQRRHIKRILPSTMEICTDRPHSRTGEIPNELTSYGLISLLTIIYKFFEKLLLKRLHPMFENNRLIPNQIHRIEQRTKEEIETNQCCSAAFLDISQAFDKV